MSQPSSRTELIDYAKRQLGYPVLEVNVADEQLDDLLDDAIQYFQERHFDGVELMYLKHKLTAEDVARGRGTGSAGITTTTATSTIVGTATTFSFQENSNYIEIPPSVIGINKIFKVDTSTVSDGLFNIRYQLFLNDLYYFSSIDLLHYTMVKTYLSDIEFLLTPEKQVRFNKRQDRLYIDTDWERLAAGDFLVIECYRVLDPNDFRRVYNDSFIKKYFTALVKRQWGQNLIKFNNVALPGGITLNGRQIYEDGQRELDVIVEKMSSTYELPPLDMIG
jgi:hypothetical protein